MRKLTSPFAPFAAFAGVSLPISFFFFSIFSPCQSLAQTGCPGCQISLPGGLAADTVYLGSIPDAAQGVDYQADVSFRMPKTTTPVAALDSVTPPGLTISKIEILGLENVPAGLKWELSQTEFNTANETDGCIRICGNPTEADTFYITVKLKATIFFISQETAFPLRMVVHPKVSATEGFSMSNYEGCGEVAVDFVNNLPSNGHPGVFYNWDFGDGTNSDAENPEQHVYSAPGIYFVNYHATFDTVGYFLESIEVLEVGCTDLFGTSAPDLYAIIDDPDNVRIFDSQPDVANASLPHVFQIGIPLGSGNYELGVWDEDSGIKGTDDECGTISFNYLSNDTIVSGDFRVVLNIKRPITEVFSGDTVLVYPQPATPILSSPNGLEACVGSADLVLGSNYGAGNQWLFNGSPIAGATDFTFMPTQSGNYSVMVSNSYGCEAESGEVAVTFHPLPAQPVYVNQNNHLKVLGAGNYPPGTTFQWFLFDAPIPGEDGPSYCATQSGTFGVKVTDPATGCSNFYETTIVFDPNFDCTIGTSDIVFSNLKIFPNPANDWAQVQLDYVLPIGGGQTETFDAAGRLVQRADFQSVGGVFTLDCSTFPGGVYSVVVLADGLKFVGRLVVVR